MKENDRSDQTEVHNANNGKPPISDRKTDTEKKDDKTSGAAKEASRTDDTIV